MRALEARAHPVADLRKRPTQVPRAARPVTARAALTSPTVAATSDVREALAEALATALFIEISAVRLLPLRVLTVDGKPFRDYPIEGRTP